MATWAKASEEAVGVRFLPAVWRVLARRASWTRWMPPLASPTPERVVDRLSVWEVVRQLPPLTAGDGHVQDRVDNLAAVGRPAAPPLRLGS